MVICPECGKDVKDAKFCSNCGALLTKSETNEEPAEEIDVQVVEENPLEETAGDIIDVRVLDDGPEEEETKKSKFCPNCGTEIAEDIKFCPQCGFGIGPSEESHQTKFCKSCGKKININAEVCPYCGVRVENYPATQEKSIVIAAILSFLFPGLGHLYNGLTHKGVSFIIAYIISAVLVVILIGFVLVFIVWIWALFDAIKTTEAINNGEYVEDKLF